MQDDPNRTPPIAIGGLGGSGTRVFSALLQAAGFYMGSCQNDPLDNLWFTVLFKRAAWGRPPNPDQPNPDDVATSVRLFTRAMTTGLANSVSDSDLALFDQLRTDLPPVGNWRCGTTGTSVDSLLASLNSTEHANRPWGWKEPNTHIFLPHLDHHIDGLKYIHIVRNGLDMAFSTNLWQMNHWSHLYGLVHTKDTSLPLRQLRFWTAANRATINYGRTHMPDRFLVIQYEDFCAQPHFHLERIQKFIGRSVHSDLTERLVRPTTIGRSEDRDLSLFPAEDLQDARSLQSIVDVLGDARGCHNMPQTTG